ncbi:hypothetical protein MWU31_22720 [Aeromonas hydrophila]|uniref:hypothetical protein n=1 Tax=Aeromonas hydrophila TaxID=644 RepID=UPI001FF1083C|nr:hypothetical protein [Aeromonas hydrophila]MCK0188038.1 hypothetical protein [Aeromonas hydrophila]UOV93206.1 hypothetical protein MUW98_06270 [Aeromonas hydrophila]
MSNEHTDIRQAKGSCFGKEWLTADEFSCLPGMPSTAKGARIRLEKLASQHPDIRRKRVKGKGYEYHISAVNLPAKKEEREVSPPIKDEQLGLWIQLWRTMKPHSRDKLLQLALAQVAKDLATSATDNNQ